MPPPVASRLSFPAVTGVLSETYEDGRGDQRSHSSSTELGGANHCLWWQVSCLDKGRWDETPLSVMVTAA